MDQLWDEYRLLICTGVLALSAILILHAAASRTIHPLEPPVVSSPIPYIGHLIGMLFYGGKYLKIIGFVPVPK
jgi:hypothetical protein